MDARTEQAYQQRIAELEARVAELSAQVARLLKNSSNSSKPPSSDIVKPPKPPPPAGGGKIGGQPGHPRHERPPFSGDEIDRVKSHDLSKCPDCGGRVRPAALPPRVTQQAELVEQRTKSSTCICPTWSMAVIGTELQKSTKRSRAARYRSIDRHANP